MPRPGVITRAWAAASGSSRASRGPGIKEPREPSPWRALRAKLLADGAHYDELVATVVAEARVSVWIATANLKSMLVAPPPSMTPSGRPSRRTRYVSFFETLADKAARGVEVRLLHASPPSGPLARDIAGLGARAKPVEVRQCPRVHLKLIAVDGAMLYLGSANVTGAGLGAKGDGKRNFEMGVLTDDEGMLDAAQARFDAIWRGAECAGCKVRDVCPGPLDERAS